jgi:1-acyl-sn-glycerol-3-phosphate acyltransferase
MAHVNTAPYEKVRERAAAVPNSSRAPAPGQLPGSSWLLYEATYLASMLGMTIGFSLRTEGRSNIPASGPVLLVANHQSFLDPILMGLSSRRHLRFLARKTLFRNRFFAALISGLNAVPIDQEGIAKEGIKVVVEQLRLGQAVVVFPEGERTPDGLLHHPKPGVHLIIRLTEVPLVPVGIAGAFNAWPRWRKFPIPAPLFLPSQPGTLAVVVGKPLDGRRYARMPRPEALQELYVEINKVQQRAERLRRKP